MGGRTAYTTAMFEPYRRDLVAKSLFRMAEILWGALFVSVLFSPLRWSLKLVAVTMTVLIFGLAWVTSPKQPPKET